MIEFEFHELPPITFRFGDYCLIEQKRYGVPNEKYIHKVIGTLKSNYFVDGPVQCPATETFHPGEVVDVVACICCGIHETEVLKYRQSDIYKVIPTTEANKLDTDSSRFKFGEMKYGAIFFDEQGNKTGIISNKNDKELNKDTEDDFIKSDDYEFAGNERSEQSKEIEAIANWYKDVSKYGLHIEVLYWALSSMKSNPNQTIFEAFQDGYNEWIK